MLGNQTHITLFFTIGYGCGFPPKPCGRRPAISSFLFSFRFFLLSLVGVFCFTSFSSSTPFASSSFFCFSFSSSGSVSIFLCPGHFYHVDNGHDWLMTSWGISESAIINHSCYQSSSDLVPFCSTIRPSRRGGWRGWRRSVGHLPSRGLGWWGLRSWSKTDTRRYSSYGHSIELIPHSVSNQ